MVSLLVRGIEDLNGADLAVRDFYNYWSGLIGSDGALPAREQIDPLEIWPHIGKVIIAELYRDGVFDPWYRLVGGEVSDLAGRSLKNRLFRDVYSKEQAEEFGALYHEIMQDKLPRYDVSSNKLPNREFVKIARLMVPFASDGRNVDVIVGIVVAAEDRRARPRRSF
ncbi:PAS domain-containing protein [Nisaea sp.]|uniref:PAS domain-containing protein n=1 Tax=Nisaea sp. TaxID=2024842 RepID=UPI002B270A81|nr:PAS domain-containing protein [Nisaea sp.]